MINNFQGIQEIMNHLIRVHGYRKIAFIAGPKHHAYAIQRYQAYLKILKENNINFDPHLVSPNYEFDPRLGKKSIEYFLDQQKLRPKKDIEAIIAVSDFFLGSVLNELHKRNIRVPQQIAITGYNNKFESISASPPVTSIDVNFEGIGQKSIELLLSIIKGGKNRYILYTNSINYPGILWMYF